MAKQLTNKQQVFVNEYLQCWNATEAAKRAGYSAATARSQGSRMLTNADISEAIQQRLDEIVMSANEVLGRLSFQARGDMADFMDVTGKRLDLVKADMAGKLGLVKKFSHTITDKSENISIELYDAQAALGLLGRYHKLFVDRVQEDNDETRAIEDIRARRIDFAALAEAFDYPYAARLFAKAGVQIPAGQGAGEE